MTLKIFLFVASIPLFSVCTSTPNGADQVADQEQTHNTKTHLRGHQSPCEFISVEEVRHLFSVPDDIQIEKKDRVLTYPTCSFKWQDGKVVTMMQAGPSQVALRKPSELMIVMVKDANASMYNTAIKVYKDVEPVKDIGEMASWGATMTQLSFLSHNYLFHVHVKASNDDAKNKTQAIAVARRIVAQL